MMMLGNNVRHSEGSRDGHRLSPQVREKNHKTGLKYDTGILRKVVSRVINTPSSRPQVCKPANAVAMYDPLFSL
jgi:hypothetical protein